VVEGASLHGDALRGPVGIGNGLILPAAGDRPLDRAYARLLLEAPSAQEAATQLGSHPAGVLAHSWEGVEGGATESAACLSANEAIRAKGG